LRNFYEPITTQHAREGELVLRYAVSTSGIPALDAMYEELIQSFQEKYPGIIPGKLPFPCDIAPPPLPPGLPTA